jgi:hypothetical protein
MYFQAVALRFGMPATEFAELARADAIGHLKRLVEVPVRMAFVTWGEPGSQSFRLDVHSLKVVPSE